MNFFTTCNTKIHADSKIFEQPETLNKKLGWENWGRSKIRKCFNTLGKEETEIRKIFNIVNLFDRLNVI